jgi:hypothetical protein
MDDCSFWNTHHPNDLSPDLYELVFLAPDQEQTHIRLVVP